MRIAKRVADIQEFCWTVFLQLWMMQCKYMVSSAGCTEDDGTGLILDFCSQTSSSLLCNCREITSLLSAWFVPSNNNMYFETY